MSDSNGKKPTSDQPTSSLGPASPEQLMANTLRFLGKIDRDPSALRAAKKLEEIDRAERRPKKP